MFSPLKMISEFFLFPTRPAMDFSVVLLKDYMYLEPDYRLTLMKIPEFVVWSQKKGDLLNGSVK